MFFLNFGTSCETDLNFVFSSAYEIVESHLMISIFGELEYIDSTSFSG